MQNQSQVGNQAVLSCWKDIALYMGKGVRTVQRWERELALPVRRPHNGGAKGPVTARPGDLDKWLSVNWSERRHLNRQVETLPFRPALPVRFPPLIETTRQVRHENQLLLAGLLQTIEDLCLTCSMLESAAAPRGDQDPNARVP